MGDIKLFRIGSGTVQELMGESVAVEKSLQTLLERNLESFLGIRLLASEYSTGKTHGGRIDTLGLDDDDCPVIIEYKRSLNENVINQGLYYFDWLMDHKAEFTLLVMKKLGVDVIDCPPPCWKITPANGGFNPFGRTWIKLTLPPRGPVNPQPRISAYVLEPNWSHVVSKGCFKS